MKTFLLTATLTVSLAVAANGMNIFSTKDSAAKTAKKNEVEVKFAGHISQKGLYDRLAVLTADSLEGRETGKPGAQKASRFIASTFKSFGLTAPVSGSYLFNVPLVEKKFESAEIVWSGMTAGQKNHNFLATGLGTGGTTNQTRLYAVNFTTSSELLESGLQGRNITGKVILVMPPNSGTLTEKLSLRAWIRANSANLGVLLAKKPAAILLVDNFAGSPVQTETELKRRVANSKVTFKGEQETELYNAIFVLSPAAIDQLLSSGSKNGSRINRVKGNNPNSSGISLATLDKNQDFTNAAGIPVSLSIKVHFSETAVHANDVLGLLPGTDLAKEILVISAHYDHLGTKGGKIYHGADDDGSGSSALMSIAGAFTDAARQGYKPRRSILFLANVGEEKGLLGSQYYSEHPVFSPANTITDLNIDMIGRVDSAHIQDSGYVYAIGSGKLSSELQQISETTNKTYSNLRLDYRYDDPKDPNQFYYRSDHYNFAKLNIPIIFYFNGVHADYHESSDTIEKINLGIYQKRAQLVFYTAWELANRDKRPAVDRVNDFK